MEIAERIQLLDGLSVAMPHDAAEMTILRCPSATGPHGRRCREINAKLTPHKRGPNEGAVKSLPEVTEVLPAMSPNEPDSDALWELAAQANFYPMALLSGDRGPMTQGVPSKSAATPPSSRQESNRSVL
jgi:hypothetical protein